MKEGVTNTLTMHVADDLDGAKQDGELRKPVLTIWFTDLCADDEIEIRFNDEVLSIEEAEVVDEGAAIIAASFRRDIHDMPGYNAYWYQFKLDPDILRRGDNTLEITTPREAKTAGFRRSVNIAEVRVRYKEFDRPEGLDPERLPIRW